MAVLRDVDARRPNVSLKKHKKKHSLIKNKNSASDFTHNSIICLQLQNLTFAYICACIVCKGINLMLSLVT